MSTAILQRAEDWIKALNQVVIDTPQSSAVIALSGRTIPNHGTPFSHIQYEVKIETAGTDDVTLEVFRCTDAESEGTMQADSDAMYSRTLLASGAEPHKSSGILDVEKDLEATDALFKFTRTGSEAGIKVTLWYRRLRLIEE